MARFPSLLFCTTMKRRMRSKMLSEYMTGKRAYPLERVERLQWTRDLPTFFGFPLLCPDPPSGYPLVRAEDRA